MGYRPWRGIVKSLQDAVFADLPILIRCETCGRMRQMHSFKLMQLLPRTRKAEDILLWKKTAGFFCKYCKKKTDVTIAAPTQWV